ncbi:MAG: hypothetical protein AB1726_06155 [Planctomycetota bacterium]
MGRRGSTFLVIWSLFFLAGCVSAPAPEDWLAVGWHGPEETFRTFQTALRGDRPDLEYACFSDAFKRRNRLGQLAWREARERLHGEIPFLDRLGAARITRVTSLAPDRAAIDARATFLWMRRSFRVTFVREDFWEVWSGDVLLADDYADFDRVVQATGDGVRVLVPGEGFESTPITRVVADQYWKIDDFAEILDAPRP